MGGEVMMDEDLDYLRRRLEEAKFLPYSWTGEDQNLAAFASKDGLVEWYCQPPGADGQPYRDRGFYCRELAMLSRGIRPRTIVEFGTSLGIGTCLLHWLNPKARLVTVDVNTETFLPGDRRVPIGYLAKHQGIPCEYVTMESWKYWQDGVDLCFIDAEHSYNAVWKDSIRAMWNQSQDHRWVIAWHDHNERHPGVMQAVAEFCAATGVALQSRPDSDTVWIEGGGM